MKKENLNNTLTHLCFPLDTDIKTLDYNPLLKKLLSEYVASLYEENANFSEESLLNEYEYLKENNKLVELFEWEFFQNSLLSNYK